MIEEISLFEKKVKLTVYIPCFGYHRFLKKAIESLKIQSFKEFICKVNFSLIPNLSKNLSAKITTSRSLK